jgi:hypothetical protein
MYSPNTLILHVTIVLSVLAEFLLEFNYNWLMMVPGKPFEESGIA